MVLGELGRLPIRFEIYKRMLLFWGRCSSPDNKNKISSMLYNTVYVLHNNQENMYKNKWSCKICEILQMCNLTDYWKCNANLNTNHFKETCKKALSLSFNQNWRNNCLKDGKCNYYKEFKLDLCLEKYLTNLPDQLKISLCKFRCSTHLLPIEKGRHLGIPRNERLCELCKDDLGDEYHYLFICPSFLISRKKYLAPYYWKKPSVEKFINLMKIKKVKSLTKLAKIVKIITDTIK